MRLIECLISDMKSLERLLFMKNDFFHEKQSLQGLHITNKIVSLIYYSLFFLFFSLLTMAKIVKQHWNNGGQSLIQNEYIINQLISNWFERNKKLIEMAPHKISSYMHFTINKSQYILANRKKKTKPV